MKKYLFTFLIVINTTITYSQKHELSAGINSGFAFFSGEDSESTTCVNGTGPAEYDNSYTNSPMGNIPALSYGVFANYKYIFKFNLFLGLEAGYENLRTKVKLDAYNDSSASYPTKGKTILANHFINTTPFVGYRFCLKKITIDALFGIEFAHSVKIKENGEYIDITDSKVKFTKDRSDSYLKSDFRPKYQLNFNYEKFTFFTSASFGVKTYYENWEPGGDAFINAVRFGIQYRIF